MPTTNHNTAPVAAALARLTAINAATDWRGAPGNELQALVPELRQICTELRAALTDAAAASSKHLPRRTLEALIECGGRVGACWVEFDYLSHDRLELDNGVVAHFCDIGLSQPERRARAAGRVKGGAEHPHHRRKELENRQGMRRAVATLIDAAEGLLDLALYAARAPKD